MNALFISDLHLSAQTPECAANFIALLQQQQAGTRLYILGDLFEAWLGDDAMGAEIAPLLQAMRNLAERGVEMYFMHGNRDFLIGADFARASGCRLLGESEVIELQGEPVLLLHGDQLCTDDHDYQAFRRQVRDPAWQAHFLSLPLDQRMALARQARDQSRQETRYKADDIMDVNPQTVEAVLRQHGVRRLIHGHTHRPGLHRFQLDGEPAWRIVLGDWTPQASLLKADHNGLQLIDPRVSVTL